MNSFNLVLLLVFSFENFKKVSSSSSSSSFEIKIAALLPSDGTRPFDMRKTIPAADMALERLNRHPHPFLRHRSQGQDKGHHTQGQGRSSLVIRYRDSRCHEAYGMNEAIKSFVEDRVDAFFGPVCDYAAAPVIRQSVFWEVPVVSTGSLALDFYIRRNSVYPLLTRAGPVNLQSLAHSFVSLLRQNSWKRLRLLYVREAYGHIIPPFCHFVVENLNFRMQEESEIKLEYYKIEEKDQIDELLLKKIGKEFAVVVLCAGSELIRDLLIRAAELNFDNGEYIFFNIDLFSSQSSLERPWFRSNDTNERNKKARKIYESLMTVTLKKPEGDKYREFSDEVKRRAAEQYGNSVYGDEEEVNNFVGAFYDAVILYALALNETLSAGLDPKNGTEITRRMWNRTFDGITGSVSIDEIGDRNADYSLLDLNPETETFEVVANYYGSRKVYENIDGKRIHWGGGRLTPPPDTPECGFDGLGCPKDEPFPDYAIVTLVLGSLLLLVSFAACFVYRHYKLEAELAEVNWRVRWDDIMFGAQERRKLERSGSRLSLAKRGSVQSLTSVDTIAFQLSNIGSKQMFTKTGSYKGTLVAIKKLTVAITINKPLLMQFKKLRDLQNDHIVRFIGVCIDSPNQCILTEYCPKGSLQDVLENDQIKLDKMFKFSLIQDIVRGMSYLHSSDIRSHGNLKSSNCVVDSRFVLKLTDFGLQHLRQRNLTAEDDNSYCYYRSKLWTAPELLRIPIPPPDGNQKGDIYSFAVICQEVIYRNGPFWIEKSDMSPQDVYAMVKNGKKPFFRPTLLERRTKEQEQEQEQGEEEENIELNKMIRRCWAEDPVERPDFHLLKSIIKRINKDGDCGGNLLDNLLSRMEQYAYNLEGLVEERTADYLEQKKKAEDLLYLMLPRSVAVQLMKGEVVQAEKFESVTIYFSDICGFTAMSAESSPMQVVDVLNDLYTTFDSVIDVFDVYKVETIGDAYMVVSGLPVCNGIVHAREIARMAITYLNAVKSFKIRHRPHDQLKLRIGIHSGPVCAGIVGMKMPRYCLFGDTVNTASRMESNGHPLKIHVSPYTKDLLDSFETFVLILRGPVEMKGKGEVVTWWLNGEINPDFPDLAPVSAHAQGSSIQNIDAAVNTCL